MEVVVDDLLPERSARPGALRQRMDRFAERVRDLGEIARAVDVALERGRRLHVILDAVEPRGDGGGEGEVRIRVGAGRAALDTLRRSVPDDAKAGGAVVVTPGDAGWRERAGHVALVRRRVRREEGEQLAQVLHPSGQELAEERVVRPEERLLSLPVPQAQVDVAARA